MPSDEACRARVIYLHLHDVMMMMMMWMMWWQDTLNNLFYKCVETLKQDHPIRIVNAIQVCVLWSVEWIIDGRIRWQSGAVSIVLDLRSAVQRVHFPFCSNKLVTPTCLCNKRYNLILE